MRGFTFFRTVLFLPQTIAGVVIAQAFVWFYAEDGPFNAAADARRARTSWARGWLGDFDWALRAVGSIGTWVTFGLCMVLFVAGVQKIPTSLYDAARVDGAGAVREFFAVTLPGLRYELVVAFVLTTINALRSFDLVYNATNGGPGDETYVPALLMYLNAFKYNEVGYACAIAVMLARRHLRARDRGQPARRPGPELMRASTFERTTTYVVLASFSMAVHLPDPLDPLPRAAPQGRPRDRASRSRTSLDLHSFSVAWDLGDFATGFKSSFIVAATVTVVSAVLSIGTGYAFGTMSFRGDRCGVLAAAARDHLPVRGDGHPALLRLPGRRPAEHLLGADPAPDRAVGLVRDVLDARVLPLLPAVADRGRADRRRVELRRAVARCCCRRRGRRSRPSARSCSSTRGTSSCSRSC